MAGLGISRLPHYLCEPYLHSGRLVDLLPDAESVGRDIIVVSPRLRQRKTGISLLRVFLESAFRYENYIDRFGTDSLRTILLPTNDTRQGVDK